MKARHWIALGLIIIAAILWVVAVEVAFGFIFLALIVELAAASFFEEKPNEKDK